MENPFSSRLFARAFTTTALAIALLFSVLFAVSVPFIESAVGAAERRAARTALDNVFEMVEQIERDLESQRQSILLGRKNELRSIVAVAESRARRLDADVSAGKLSRQEARRRLLDELRDIRYGRDDYIWASDYRSVLVSHPDPKLDNADFSQVRDTRDNLIVPPMVQGAQLQGEGYYSYWWRRLGEETPVEKLSYYKHLPRFDLVIGTGVYVDDVDLILQSRRTLALDNLRSRLRDLHFARTGYMYIFDSKLRMLIHPNRNVENTDFTELLEPETRRPIGPLLMAAADRPEGVRYKWDHPDDPGRYVYDKISWVRHFEPTDWYIASSVYMDELKESALVLRQRLLLAFLATLALSLVLIYFFVKRLVAPLKRLSDTARKVKDGDVSARSGLRRDDEIGVVASAFDVMVDRLQDNIEHLDAHVKQRTAELEKANAELMKLDRLKSDFLSSVSHELRTPLTSIRGFASLIEREFERSFASPAEADPALRKKAGRIQDNLKIILKESERLTRLINDVLDLAKIEAGRTEWRDVVLPVADFVRDAVNATTGMFEHKPAVALRLEIQPDLPPFVGDADRMQQVLVNLLNNAAKFTDAGSVTVRAWLTGEGRIRIDVSDTGIGFPPEDAESIFDKFQQSKQGDTLMDRPKGTGLGLAICREIVNRHGGRVWARSEPGAGSVFSLELPAADAAAKLGAGGTVTADETPAAQAAAGDTHAGPGRSRVLVVDDDPSVRDYFTQLLQEQGYEVVTAGDGEAALAAARRHRPRLITMDLAMPVMDGRTAIDRLRADPELKGIPIMVISAIPGWEAAGGDLAMSKPLDERRFLENIGALLQEGGATVEREVDFLVLHEDGLAQTAVPESFAARCRVSFCPVGELEARIQAGFQGMVAIPVHLLDRVDIDFLNAAPTLQVMIMPTADAPLLPLTSEHQTSIRGKQQ